MHILPQKISTKKWPQNDLKLPKIAQKWPKIAQIGPKMTQNCQNGPKMTQNGPKISTSRKNSTDMSAASAAFCISERLKHLPSWRGNAAL